MEIKLKQVDRDTAIAKCESCNDKIPHLHFYIEAKTKKFKTFGDCLIHTRKRMVDFANYTEGTMEFQSFNGNKSRNEFLHPDNVRTAAKRVWEEDEHILAAHSIACTCLDEPHIDKLITGENFRGFIDNEKT